MRFGKGLACVGPSGRRNLPTIKVYKPTAKLCDHGLRQNPEWPLMQPNVAKTSKTCFETNSFTCSSKGNRTQRTQRAQKATTTQTARSVEVLKLHFKEFLGTLLYQIKHKTIIKLHTSQKVPKGKIAIFYSNEIHFRGPSHLVQSNSLQCSLDIATGLRKEV